MRARLARGQAVAVVGEAGIGKTALLRGACDAEGIDSLIGGGLQTLSSVSYLPLARALGEHPPDGDATGVAEFAARRADGRALLLDDLHWADPETLAVLPALAASTPLLAAVRRGDPNAARAIAALEAAGAELVELGPLGESAARELLLGARAGHPAPRKLEEILANARGNPFLLLELSGEDPTASLDLALLARLHPHGERAKRSAARAALLRRPADPRLLGDGVEELLDAGLLAEEDEGLVLRHALLADSIADGLDPNQRRALHAELAASLDDPGEAAWHHRAAGEIPAAHERALEAAEAATGQCEQAEHLRLAAACAFGTGADRVRLRAATALNDVGEHEAAMELLSAVTGEAVPTTAERALQEGRALCRLRRPAEAERSFRKGLGAIGGSSSELEVRLLLANADSLQQTDWGSSAALERSREAHELSLATGFARAEAEYVLGVALYLRGELEEAIEHATEALQLAQAERDQALEFRILQLLGTGLAAVGRGQEARDVLGSLVTQAHDAGQRNLEALARCLLTVVSVLAGADYATGVEEAEELLANPMALGPRIEELQHLHALALADLGRIDEARDHVAAALESTNSATGRSLLLGTLAEIEWLARRPRQALRAAKESLASDTESPNRVLSEIGLAWATLETGGSPTPLSPATGFPMDRAVRLESEALAALGEPGTTAQAAPLFAGAASIWAPLERRSELRCLWASAEAQRLAGDSEAAREGLLKVEAEAERIGLMPLLGRIRRSLREVGIRRTSERAAPTGKLTAREQEVMALVADGLASADIAARLGIARSTVETQVGSATRKLGARNRRHAAMIALDGKPA